MLHLILTILKIIGIVVLVLIGILLLTVVLLLFVPIRYRIEGKKEGEELWVKVKISWLVHLVRAGGVYPQPGRTIVKVLIFTVFDSAAEPKTKKQKTRKQKIKKQKKASVEGRAEAEQEKGIEQENNINQENSINQEAAREIKELSELEEETAGKEADAVEKDTLQNKIKKGLAKIIERIIAFFRKIKSIFQNIRYTICRLCDKIKVICADITYYKEIFAEQETKEVFHLCKNQLIKIWKHIKPKKFKAELTIGTGEPDTTGTVLGLHGILYPYLGNNVNIVPDFERQILEGTVFIKGRLTVWTFISVAVKIYFDKNIRYLYKRLKREEKANGRI